MKRRSILLPLVLMLLALAAGFFLYRMRGNVEVLTTRSLPAIRILGDLRDTVSRLQISLLEGALRKAPLFPGEQNAYLLQLRVAEGLIEDYRATAANPRDEELIDRVSAAFELYQAKVEAIGREGMVEVTPEQLAAHHLLQDELAELRNYRLGRVQDRVSTVERAAAGMWKTNFVVLIVLIVAMLTTALVAWSRRLSEPNPQDF